MKPSSYRPLIDRYGYALNIAVEAVFANRFRSMLTALGIIFGVAAVIAMMAIGNGARQEILDQIRMVGVNNIVITPILDQTGTSGSDSEESSGQKMQKKFSPGLTLEDAMSIGQIIPGVDRVSPEVTFETTLIKSGKQSGAKLTGVTNDFFRVYSLGLQEGQYFSDEHLQSGSPVCIISPAIKSKFFSNEEPLGKTLKCGGIWLTVIGIVENRTAGDPTAENIGIGSYVDNIYAPVQTVIRRYKDRSLINSAALTQKSISVFFDGGGIFSMSGSEGGGEETNLNQLDKIVVQVSDSKIIPAATKAINNMLKRRHMEVEDFKVEVPELLLKQEQRTKDIFNIVLGVIASISLIVGGIGIMNIMLASVMERIKEIGIRRATGATRRDIIMQFLTEATLISLTGGIIGIVLGIVFALVITRSTGILTIVSPLSIFISFGVSAFIGILFGYMPAKRAAEQDPLESLRYE